ncbi:MAG: holin [Clostridia bacterium]|nr:holin [Clostridia bacterium]
MKFDITAIVQALITLITALITTFALPYIKEKLSVSKLEKLSFWVETAVKAAEQIFGSKTGLQKKEYVVNFLLSKGIVVDIDEVTALIESSVYKLTKEQENQTV